MFRDRAVERLDARRLRRAQPRAPEPIRQLRVVRELAHGRVVARARDAAHQVHPPRPRDEVPDRVGRTVLIDENGQAPIPDHVVVRESARVAIAAKRRAPRRRHRGSAPAGRASTRRAWRPREAARR